MDALKTAAVDITLLVIAARALGAQRTQETQAHDRPHKRWAKQIRRALAAYQRALWRSDDARFDAAALARCRVAAEHEMPLAVQSQAHIKDLLEGRTEALEGYASARNDLWRLAHVVVNLRGVRSRLARGATSGLVGPRRSPGRRLQRGLRRVMTEYTRELLQEPGDGRSAIKAARRAAGDRLDGRCFEFAADLMRVAAVASAVEDGVLRPMQAIAEDWSPTKGTRGTDGHPESS